MDAAANNAGGVGPGVYAIITSTGSIPAGAHGVIERYTGRSWPSGKQRVSRVKDLRGLVRMDRKMDKYIKLEDAIDLFWTVDPENNGDDGCTVVLKCGSYDSNEIETLLSELPTIEIAPPNEPLTQAELNEMYLNEVWLEYPDGSGETAIVVLGTIYSVNALEGAGLDLADYIKGETLDCPTGAYKVYRRPPEG